jgi:hypothetical protein
MSSLNCNLPDHANLGSFAEHESVFVSNLHNVNSNAMSDVSQNDATMAANICKASDVTENRETNVSTLLEHTSSLVSEARGLPENFEIPRVPRAAASSPAPMPQQTVPLDDFFALKSRVAALEERLGNHNKVTDQSSQNPNSETKFVGLEEFQLLKSQVDMNCFSIKQMQEATSTIPGVGAPERKQDGLLSKIFRRSDLVVLRKFMDTLSVELHRVKTICTANTNALQRLAIQQTSHRASAVDAIDKLRRELTDAITSSFDCNTEEVRKSHDNDLESSFGTRGKITSPSERQHRGYDKLLAELHNVQDLLNGKVKALEDSVEERFSQLEKSADGFTNAPRENGTKQKWQERQTSARISSCEARLGQLTTYLYATVRCCRIAVDNATEDVKTLKAWKEATEANLQSPQHMETMSQGVRLEREELGTQKNNLEINSVCGSGNHVVKREL